MACNSRPERRLGATGRHDDFAPTRLGQTGHDSFRVGLVPIGRNRPTQFVADALLVYVLGFQVVAAITIGDPTWSVVPVANRVASLATHLPLLVVIVVLNRGNRSPARRIAMAMSSVGCTVGALFGLFERTGLSSSRIAARVTRLGELAVCAVLLVIVSVGWDWHEQSDDTDALSISAGTGA